ncbi:MAG: hypothetical protein ACOC7U_04965 [Spirochaetota bacterium]
MKGFKNKRKAVITVVAAAAVMMLALGGFAFAHGGENEEQVELSGSVALRTPGGVFLKLSDGTEYKLALGPWWRLEEMGLELKDGDRITVTGYAEDEVVFVSSLNKGQETYKIADLEDLASCPHYGHGMRGKGMRSSHRGGFNKHPRWGGGYGGPSRGGYYQGGEAE